MPKKLKNDMQVWKLARDLGLKPKDDPLTDIIRHCLNRLRSILKDYPCETLTDLLETAATILDTVFVEIHSDEDLERLKSEYLEKGETAFALLEEELGPKADAITFRLREAKRGDRQFVSVIDCRDHNAFRAYFSKWHELAHLLTLTQQLRFKFCRTHAEEKKNDPEEAVMDIIAGEIGFLPEMVKPHAKGEISFEKIDELREKLCPGASFQASVIGFVKRWPSPCILVEVGLGYKKCEVRKLAQNSFGFIDAPTAELRVLHASANEQARRTGIFIPKNVRIPRESIVYQVFSDDLLLQAEAVENLSSWMTSTSPVSREQRLLVRARRNGDHIMALILLDECV
jgi:hypothetical protein